MGDIASIAVPVGSIALILGVAFATGARCGNIGAIAVWILAAILTGSIGAALRSSPDVSASILGSNSLLIALCCLRGASSRLSQNTTPASLLGTPILLSMAARALSGVHDGMRLDAALGLASSVPAFAVMADLWRGRFSPCPEGVLAGQGSMRGLMSCRAFDARLSEAFGAARRAGDDIALLVVRIGIPEHEAGHLKPGVAERRLGGLIEVLRDVLYRPIDVAGHHDDTHVLVLLPGTDPAAAQIVAERIDRGLARYRRAASLRGDQLPEAKLGVAAIRPRFGETSADLLAVAFDALAPKVLGQAECRSQPHDDRSSSVGHR